jgi:hypothetical protein
MLSEGRRDFARIRVPGGGDFVVRVTRYTRVGRAAPLRALKADGKV